MFCNTMSMSNLVFYIAFKIERRPTLNFMNNIYRCAMHDLLLTTFYPKKIVVDLCG